MAKLLEFMLLQRPGSGTRVLQGIQNDQRKLPPAALKNQSRFTGQTVDTSVLQNYSGAAYRSQLAFLTPNCKVATSNAARTQLRPHRSGVWHIPPGQAGNSELFALPFECAAKVESAVVKCDCPQLGQAVASPLRRTSFSNFVPQSSQTYS